ncbi:MAG: protein kinase [bacterium]
MLRLTTFGGIVLRQDGEPHLGAASQRRRLALLAVIATAAGRPVSREKLLGYFWPESDSEHARHALRQSLHAVQRALATDDLFLGTDALRLNPALITSDVQDVEDAVDGGAHQRVVGLMKGPFLDGFFVSEAPELERWVETQRGRYASLFISALEALATDASARDDHAMATAWWRRLTAEHPTNSRYVLGLIRSLAAGGDRSGALLQASGYESLVRDQLGAEPDSAVAEAAARLRTNDVRAPTPDKSAGAAAAAATLSTTRDRARDRQRDWLERTLGERLVVDAGIPSRGAIVAYQAYDRERRVPVEIHLLDPGISALADVDTLMDRLDRIAALRDPHLSPLYEYGNADGVIYFTVARPLGESLRDTLAREQQLAVHDAVAIAADIADALAAAHDADVLHSDLRPKYVFVSDGHAVLTGVGIADALAAATTPNRTSTALRLGSPAYQSPEQLVGDTRLDQRSDVYSLGCILYEMLAGEVPFASQTRGTMVSGRLTSVVPSLIERRDTVSEALSAVVARCLARAPSDRYRSGREVALAIRNCL